MHDDTTPPELPKENQSYQPVIHKKIETDGEPTKNVTISVHRAPMQENTWAMFAHLSTFLGWMGIPLANVLAPLIIWQVKKENMPFAANHAKEALNFQLTMIIYLIISFILFFVFIGVLTALATLVLNLVCTILASIKANEGKNFRYPMTIRFVK